MRKRLYLALLPAFAVTSVGCGGASPPTQTIPSASNAAATSTVAGPTERDTPTETTPTETTPTETTPSETTPTETAPAESGSAIPSESTSYPIELTGRVSQWTSQSNDYEPSDDFDRSGTLIIEPRGDGYAVGVFTGSFADGSTGALHFVSNSYVLRHIDSVADFVWQAEVDAASVEVDDGAGTVSVKVDSPTARAVQLNNFAMGFDGSQKQILDGKVELELGSDGSVSGTLDLYGGGYIDPGNSFPVDRIEATLASQ